jgi:hypothetical protein
MTVFNARVLASLVTAAGNALSKRLTAILPALIKVLEEEKVDELLAALDEALACVTWFDRGSGRVEHVDATTSWKVRAFGPECASFSDLRCTEQKAVHRRAGRALASTPHLLRGICLVPRGLGTTTDLTA